jgi:RNA-binding protein YlmH
VREHQGIEVNLTSFGAWRSILEEIQLSKPWPLYPNPSVCQLTLVYSTKIASARELSEMIAATMIFVNSSTSRSDAVLSAMRLDRLAPDAVRVSRTEVLLE